MATYLNQPKVHFQAYNIFMESLQGLCDIANGIRRQFFNMSAKAASLFGEWVQDWHKAKTLEEVLDEWEMGHVVDEYMRVQTKCEGKKLQIDKMMPATHWKGDGISESSSVNDDLLYLVLSLVTAPECERMHQCKGCHLWFVAKRRSQKYCAGLCGRRDASRRKGKSNNAMKHDRRIKACMAAYKKFCDPTTKTRKSDKEYVLAEANRRLPLADKMGGAKLQVNFITRHAEAIGIPKPL